MNFEKETGMVITQQAGGAAEDKRLGAFHVDLHQVRLRNHTRDQEMIERLYRDAQDFVTTVGSLKRTLR